MPAAAIVIVRRDDFRALRLKPGTPEPAMHRRQGLVRRPCGYPRLHWHVIFLASDLHVRVVAVWRRQRIFAVNDIRRPACRFANAAQVTLALVIGLIHNDDAMRAILL